MRSSGRGDRRLSLAECRSELSQTVEPLNDEQLLVERDRMYALAAVLVGAYRNSKSVSLPSLVDVLESDWAEVEERAAIFEFDGNLSRDQAEKLALSEYLKSQSRH